MATLAISCLVDGIDRAGNSGIDVLEPRWRWLRRRMAGKATTVEMDGSGLVDVGRVGTLRECQGVSARQSVASIG